MQLLHPIQPFHLAIPTHDLQQTYDFYTKVLGCAVGRRTEHWIDFNFFGHQLSIHLKPDEVATIRANTVDGKQVPVRHFGVVLEWNEWHTFAERLKSHHIQFIIEPYIRFAGQVGEQATLFFLDPSNNALEFKSFKDSAQLFATT